MLTALCIVLALTSGVYAQSPVEVEMAVNADEPGDEPAAIECPETALLSDKDGFDCMMEYELPGSTGGTSSYRVYWSVDGTLLKMGLEGETDGWVGIAFAGEAGSMVPSDFIIGYVDGDTVSVLPYYSEARAIAEANEEPGITLMDVSGEETDGKTTIYFTRDTAEEGNVPIDPMAATDINFAVGPEDSLSYHMSRRASGVITFA